MTPRPPKRASRAKAAPRTDAAEKRRAARARAHEGSGLTERIARGASAHYRDADYYDHTYRRRRDDVRFYTRLALEHGGPALELGAGSGRVTLALARAGIEVLGVDPAPEMLAQAEKKRLLLPPEARARARFRRGDARRLRFDRRFRLILAPFNVFMHLYTRRDWEQALAGVLAHLAPRGRLVFDVSMPDLRAMLRQPGKLYRGPSLRQPETGARYAYFEAFEYEPVAQVQMVSLIFQNLEQLDDLRIVPLSQRQLFPQELEALLHYNGFVVEQRWGDFDRGPLTAESESQVIVARAR
jgi:SAM-dependent methyltransferase